MGAEGTYDDRSYEWLLFTENINHFVLQVRPCSETQGASQVLCVSSEKSDPPPFALPGRHLSTCSILCSVCWRWRTQPRGDYTSGNSEASTLYIKRWSWRFYEKWDLSLGL